MDITYLGHSCFLLKMNGKNVLVDPFISGNPLANNINIEDIKADYILITHGHGDHVTDVEKIAGNNNASLISNFEIISYYQNKGFEGHGMNHGGKFSFDFGHVKYVTAQHSSMLPDGSNGGNPGGFVLWTDNTCIYIAGDTALTMDMKLIPMTCPKLDLAILPIGDNFTMGYEDAIFASDFLDCDKIMGCHFDTFPPIKIDHAKAKELFAKQNKELIIPEIGNTY
ncbi:MAG: metal-dependent hydrolase [Bacteroidetes bacterium]|nr:metal-dependent hydrolase [Bacteroidota bacterium]